MGQPHAADIPQTTLAELETANRDLLARHEQLQTANEQLRTANDRLLAVSAEQQKQIAQLTHDVDNLLIGTDSHTILLDKSFRIRRFTPKIADLFKLSPQDVGKPVEDYVDAVVCDGLVDKLANALSSGHSYAEEVRDRCGKEFLLRILPYKIGRETSGVVLALRDVTTIKNAEAQFRAAFEAAPCGMIVTDAEGKIVLVNAQAERAFGYRRDELVGRAVEILVPEHLRAAHPEHRRRFLENPTVREMGSARDLSAVRKDGSEFPVEVGLSPLEMSQGQFVLIAVADVTKRKRAELQANQEIQRRDLFLAMLSHELRNPMGAVLHASDTLSRITPQRPDRAGEIDAAVGVIRRQTEHMARLLDDLLELSRITQNKIEFRKEVVDLTLIVDAAVESVRHQSEAKQLNLSVEVSESPLYVFGDPTRLKQAQVNLLANAVKYTAEGGDVHYGIRCQNGQVIITVRDTGEGIPPEMLEDVFQPFVQSNHTLDRTRGGLGIGLALARAIVEEHDGSIAAFSEGQGRGSEFTIRLPQTRQLPKTKLPAAQYSFRGRKLLLVEDNDDARSMLAQILRYEGFDVTEANDGGSGLDVFRKSPPDVAVIDIGLPRMDGYQLAREIRNSPQGSRALLIALTGYGRDSDRRAILRSGYDEHLVKPLNLNALFEIIERRLQTRAS